MPRFAPLPERRPAIVAGASSGIGEATAIELAAHGFPVALGARRVEKLDDIVGKINAEGGEAVGFHLDVTDPNSVKSFVAQSVDALGEIEVLVAGAGDTYFGKLAEISTDEFESQLQIHLIGANRLASAVLPGMLDRQRGDLIFVGSDVALRQRPHMGAYGAAKAALLAMVNNFQMELEGTGVRASIVHPGPTKTSMGWSLPADKIGPVTTTFCARPIWDAPSRSSPRHRAAALSQTWSYSPRPRWRSPRTARNSHSAKTGCQNSDFAKRQRGARYERR
jgi:NAD(P)-dependent dehydrogenase (short-subunit alcohol dehydrogenase family)